MVNFYDPHSLGLTVTKVSGVEAYCICPYHSDETPSASFNIEKGLFVCYACSTKKNAWHIAKDLGGEIIEIDSPEAFAARLSTEDDGEWTKFLHATTGLKSHYLKSRGVTKRQVISHELRWMRNKIAFPQFDTSMRLTGYQIRNERGRLRYYFAGERQPVWPMKALLNAKKDDIIYVTEGVFGALRIERLGNIAIATMGAGALSAAIPLLAGRRVVVAFDNDWPGILGAAKLIASIDGATAIWPPVEADALTPKYWHSVIGETTDDIVMLAASTDDEAKFIANVRKFRNML